MIRAFSVSGGEPRGCSQQRSLPAIRAAVVRFLEAVSDEYGMEQMLPVQSWRCPHLLPAEMGEPSVLAAEVAFQKPPSIYQHRWLLGTVWRLSTSQYLPEMDAKGSQICNKVLHCKVLKQFDCWGGSMCAARHSSSKKARPMYSSR